MSRQCSCIVRRPEAFLDPDTELSLEWDLSAAPSTYWDSNPTVEQHPLGTPWHENPYSQHADSTQRYEAPSTPCPHPRASLLPLQIAHECSRSERVGVMAVPAPWQQHQIPCR